MLVEIDDVFNKLPDLDLEEQAEIDVPGRLRAVVAAMEAISVRLRAFPSLLPNDDSRPVSRPEEDPGSDDAAATG